MPVLKYPLYDFIATVPKCLETTTLAVVLEIFELQQCDRLVIVNEQKYPVGLLYAARLVPQLLAVAISDRPNQNALKNERYQKFLDLEQAVSTLSTSLIEPIQTIPASLPLEELGWFVRSKHGKIKTSLDWALIDSDNEFLGLVDSCQLLQFLAKLRVENSSVGSAAMNSERGTRKEYIDKKSVLNTVASATECKKKANKSHTVQAQPLIQLLERLPWPLMLQTSTGEVVTQNPAWWQQLGVFKDPEGVRLQVEAILAPTGNEQSEHGSEKVVGTFNVKGGKNQLSRQDNTTAASSETRPGNNVKEQLSHGSRCYWDSQLSTCTCVVEVQNGQERIWQFAKIPLDSPELRILNLESQSGLIQDRNNRIYTDSELRNQQSQSKSGHLQFCESNSNDLWLVLATDVTEQQQLCKELAAKNADLIQLLRLKDEFLACISHELKTPLTAVLGLSRLLADKQLGELNERQARYAGLIHQSGRHLMSVVNDILDLTRMETGQMELTPTPVNIRAVCDRAISEAKTIHTSSSKTPINAPLTATHPPDHKFSLSIEQGLEQMVADELRLRQMLIHLLSNALKFTEIGGEIGLSVTMWEGWVAFTIWDSGIGIPEHQQHLIFQKFQQLENPLTRQFEGTGLGLVLTRALARLHGGDVSFLSGEGKGSQFTLLLPPCPPKTNFAEPEITNQRPPETVTKPVNRRARKTRNRLGQESKILQQVYPSISPALSSSHLPTSSHRLVLVVEAVARYIDNMTEHLTGLGYRVVIARSGCEAVEKARRLQPKAIFLNPLLPLLSGWDVLTLLKSDASTRHIPVIVTATRAEKDQAYANRADGFLSLPVQPQTLAPLLESLCTTPEAKQITQDNCENNSTNAPLRILRLVNAELESINCHPSLREHRVIEVDDLDQAELLARVWQFDVALLDTFMPNAGDYLEKLAQHPRLAALPLVTCNVEITHAASLVAGLSVFPCLTAFGTDREVGKADPLVSVLQIAAGICCPPSILVVDFTMLPDLLGVDSLEANSLASITDSYAYSSHNSKPLATSRGSEWFQALLQYLQTAGLKAAMARSWVELLQQIRHQSVDLLLLHLGQSPVHQEVRSALIALQQLPFDKPPVLVLDRRLNPSDDDETVVNAIATQILKRSISMEDLLNQINQTLNVNG
ncbi:MAG: response regulator [Cyanomargarita calcarea GSE-NOS-MK-12-04C]|uniref:histidine kinase n=1 Tax=Cyanomargarita calcarea GSE-NOS-MK-12-04C TaxID=2839659 RepID=A0A951USN9_9CYAN|nr:response regulator [Cyanomargarita calcarea GSE-NOS-MK-12-04C]